MSWRFWRDISSGGKDHHAGVDGNASLQRAIFQIVAADISMSLDNVLAVAGASIGHMDVLIIGLLLSVALMGAAANLIARLLERFRWISYVGLAIVVYVALSMIWKGTHDVIAAFLNPPPTPARPPQRPACYGHLQAGPRKWRR